MLRPRYLVWLVAPLLFVWALSRVSLPDVWVVLARLGLAQILALALANGLVLLTLSGRWWLILRAQGYPIPYFTLAGYRLAAFAISYFTPGPQFGGEPLQVYLVQRRHRVARPTAISAVALDKSLELFANFAFLLGGVACILLRQVFPWPLAGQVIMLPISLLAIPAGFLAAIWLGKHPLSGLLNGVGSLLSSSGFSSLASNGLSRNSRWLEKAAWLARYQRIYQAIRESEEQATRLCRESPGILAQALAVSLISWAAMAGEFWLMLHTLGLNLTLVQVVGVLTAARLAILLPLPGGLGTLEASQVLALGALGHNPAAGISLSLLIRMRDLALGGLGLWWGGLKSQLP